MIKLNTAVFCLFLGLFSTQTFALNMSAFYASAEEVVIPGYSEPPSTAPIPSSPGTNSAPTQPNVPDISNNNPPSNATNSPPTNQRLTPQAGYKSCERYIPITMQMDVIQANLKNLDLDQDDTANIYRWQREGEPNLEITFQDSNTPIDVKGNLPNNIPNAKDMNFSLADVQKALSSQGELIGHVYIYSKGEGKLKIYTDANNKSTRFTSDLACTPK